MKWQVRKRIIAVLGFVVVVVVVWMGVLQRKPLTYFQMKFQKKESRMSCAEYTNNVFVFVFIRGIFHDPCENLSKSPMKNDWLEDYTMIF